MRSRLWFSPPLLPQRLFIKCIGDVTPRARTGHFFCHCPRFLDHIFSGHINGNSFWVAFCNEQSNACPIVDSIQGWIFLWSILCPHFLLSAIKCLHIGFIFYYTNEFKRLFVGFYVTLLDLENICSCSLLCPAVWIFINSIHPLILSYSCVFSGVLLFCLGMLKVKTLKWKFWVTQNHLLDVPFLCVSGTSNVHSWGQVSLPPWIID